MLFRRFLVHNMYVDREDRVAIMYSPSVYKSRTGVKPGVTTQR